MDKYSVSEIFQFAIKIEENGERFYRSLAKKLDDKELKELFEFLADAEIKHKNTFQDMVAKFENYESQEIYPQEYFTYLQSYVKNTIFDIGQIDEEIERINDPISAFTFAIKMEADSILYYMQIKDLVPKEQHNVIDEIIEEERKHYVDLSELRKWT